MIQRVHHVTFGSVLIRTVLSIGLLAPAPVLAAAESDLNFKVYNPAASIEAEANKAQKSTESTDTTKTETTTDSSSSATSATSAATDANTASLLDTPTETPEANTSADASVSDNKEKTEDKAEEKTENKADATFSTNGKDAVASTGKVLQGYIRVVPSGTKVPIIMDTAVDSDTSQEGDEFAARTSEDLNIDGSTIIPAGSVIKGRIAQLNAPRHLNRSGSVGLKFDTVTTPDNRQIPLVANIVARGGVVHAKRGLKDIAIDTGTFTLPTAVGLGIGVLAGGSNNGSSGIGRGGGALIGAGIGAALGVAILMSKKGKKVDVRPGDELKIELAEDLRMPM